jgi:alkylmercury lyase
VRAQFGLPELVLHLTRLLAAGHPVTVSEAASAGGWSEDELRAELPGTPVSTGTTTAASPGSA